MTNEIEGTRAHSMRSLHYCQYYVPAFSLCMSTEQQVSRLSKSSSNNAK